MVACALYRSLGKRAPARYDQQPQGLEVPEGAFVISLKHGTWTHFTEQTGSDATGSIHRIKAYV